MLGKEKKCVKIQTDFIWTLVFLYTGVAELGDRIFVIGGNDGVSFLNSIECYDPHTNRWTLLPPMSRPRAGIGAAALDGRIYAIGGFDGASRLDIVEMFEPRMNAWTEAASLNSWKFDIVISRLFMNVYTTENVNIFVFHFYQQQKISTKLEGKLARNCMSSEQPIRSLLYCLMLLVPQKFDLTCHIDIISQLPFFLIIGKVMTQVTLHDVTNEVIPFPRLSFH